MDRKKNWKEWKGLRRKSRPPSEIDMHRQIFYLLGILSLCIFNTKSICRKKIQQKSTYTHFSQVLPERERKINNNNSIHPAIHLALTVVVELFPFHLVHNRSMYSYTRTSVAYISQRKWNPHKLPYHSFLCSNIL